MTFSMQQRKANMMTKHIGTVATALFVLAISVPAWAAPGAHGPNGEHLDAPATTSAPNAQRHGATSRINWPSDGARIGTAMNTIIASDITAQKVAESHVRELNRQLEGKIEQVSDVNRELEAFSYSVSHDLRAPLRHISGFADKLERHLGERNDEKSRHYISIISGSAKRMSQLIDDLLVYSRLGRSALRMQPVDLQSMVADVRAMLDANVHQDTPGHRVEWRIAPLPIVVGDDNMLRQVWLNLLGNAVKYSARSEPARIEVHYAREDDGTHRFEVRDNGVGFDMAYASKLFGVFQRLHADTDFQGTGIGLASVRRVLSRHGGRVWAESTPGQGSVFYFTLPSSNDITITEPRQ